MHVFIELFERLPQQKKETSNETFPNLEHRIDRSTILYFYFADGIVRNARFDIRHFQKIVIKLLKQIIYQIS